MTEQVIHAPGWAPDTPPPKKSYTREQLMDMQGDLMIWCPDLKPNFVNGVDPETGIKDRADNGQVPQGIIAGYVWTAWLAFYPPQKRQILYNRILAKRYTHVAIQVAEQIAGDQGYHGLRPITQADADGYGALMNTIHQELLDKNLIPVCAGVAPVGTPGGARVAPGFDTSKVLIAMSDWDNTTWAAGRIKALAETFPNALLYYERPGNKTQAGPDTDPTGADPVPPTNGGLWISAMQRKYPNFVGVMYEVNNPDGLDVCTAELQMANAFWRDLQQLEFETDTYWKFWEDKDESECIAFNDQLLARNPQLHGFFSGATPHTPPPDVVAPPETPGGSVGDMIPVDQITFVGGPNIGAWPATATITRLELRTTGIHVEFTKKDGDGSWPDTPDFSHQNPPGMGPLQYSMGLALNVNGRWYASAPIEVWRDKDELGGQIQAQAVEGTNIGQIPKNWFYNNRWEQLNGYQPKPGEQIGFFVAAGDCRNGVNPVQERSNIVAFPLPQDGQPATFVWEP